MSGQRETFIDFAEDWYDRNAGPGETWTLGDLYDALIAAGVLGVNADTIRAKALEALANEEAHWAARAWRSEEAETVSKMRKAILDRAAQYRKAAGE